LTASTVGAICKNKAKKNKQQPFENLIEEDLDFPTKKEKKSRVWEARTLQSCERKYNSTFQLE